MENEREIRIDDETREVEIVDGCVKRKGRGYIYCCLIAYATERIECQTDCAAFCTENGYACCHMMQGNQIIGKIITSTER